MAATDTAQGTAGQSAGAAPGLTWAGLMLDCPDAKALATFYGELTGWGVAGADEEKGEWAYLTPPGTEVMIGFQKVEDYRPPRWPTQDPPQQFHLDFRVSDVPAAVRRAIELGGREADTQPGGDAWRVMLDPAGHPFCLCPAPADS